MAGKNMFFRGVPTDPDVKLLTDAFPKIPTEVIPYGAIEEIIGVSKDTNRFKSVLEAWKNKIERETNEILITIRGEGVKLATPKERVTYCGKKINSGVKFVARGAKVAAFTDTRGLSDEDKKICDHFSRAASAVSMAIRVSPKELRPPEGF